ncbi:MULTISPECIES: hypothetical protein [unclassified Streptomyces]|nr:MULTISPECIES: hypothetical protein [unclassified Streptomyces]MCX5398675.1 hypothetical protein [Streptomyces sp. NBC_00102]
MNAILALQGLEETAVDTEALGYTNRGSWISVFGSCFTIEIETTL